MARGESTAELAQAGSLPRRIMMLGSAAAEPEDAPRVILVNLVALGSLVACIPWLILQLSLAGGPPLATYALVVTLSLVLVLQRWEQNYFAAVSLVAAGPLGYAAWRWSGSSIDGDHLFLLLSIFLASVVFPLRHRWTALALSVLVFANYVAWVLGAEPRGGLAGGVYAEASVPAAALRDSLLVGILALISHRARVINHTAEDAVEAERGYADALIRGVLPEPVALLLKRNEQVLARRYPDVSVIYIELDDFRQLCAKLDPEALVGLLDRLYGRFDRLCTRHGIERVKSSGPLYIAAAGIQIPRPDHAEVAAAFALELCAEAEELRVMSKLPVALRVGIDSGPVVAGAVGQRKYSYDVWGPTVDTAQLLERSCAPQRILVSAQSYAKINHRFNCEVEPSTADLARTARRYLLVSERERAAMSVRGRVLSPSEESWAG